MGLAVSLDCSSSRICESSSAGSFSSSAPLGGLLLLRSTPWRSRASASLLPLAPLGLLAAGGAEPLAIGGALARPGGRFRALVGDGGCGTRRRGACRLYVLLQRRRIGQRCERALRRVRRLHRALPDGLEIGLTLRQARCAAPRAARAPQLRHRSPGPHRAHRVRPRAPRARDCSAVARHSPLPESRVALLRAPHRRPAAIPEGRRPSCGEPVGAQQPLGGRGARASRDEAVPAPHDAVAGDETLADRERLALVRIGNGDLAQAARQLRRSART